MMDTREPNNPPQPAQRAFDQEAGSPFTQSDLPNPSPRSGVDRRFRVRLTLFFGAIIAAIVAAFAVGLPGWQDYIAQETAKGQLRAYVVMRPNDIAVVEEGVLPRVQNSFHNIGQTPAYDGGSASHITVSEYPLDTKLITNDCGPISDRPTERRWFVGKVSRPDTVRQGPFTAGETKAIKEGKAAVYFHGALCYRDIFNASHRTDFCMYWKWDAGRMSPALYCDQGNNAD